MKKVVIFIILSCGLVISSFGQFQLEWIDTSSQMDYSLMYFFTNRPAIISDSGHVSFQDKFQYGTYSLTFGTYHIKADSFDIKFKASYGDNPTLDVPRDKNFMYKIYENLVVKKGIRHFEIVIPGYAKTFSDQRQNFMKGLKDGYQDKMLKDVAIITYTWADEWRAYKYHKAKQSAEEGAVDYFLFHHLLSSMMRDTSFINNMPHKFTVGLLCTSMGNELLKRFILKVDEKGIELHKTYNHILMVGSDASWDSFEEGKGFDRIDRFTNSVYVVMNRKDGPLIMSQAFNMKKRLGRHGPRRPWELPDYVQVYDITGQLILKDLAKLNHDYLLRNPYFQDILLSGYNVPKEH
ncbi:MAG: alpha/beta hydrolase [Bacteroidales bacterium]|nr:alpha/beta hydrolase [Bacteroidales bacterium]